MRFGIACTLLTVLALAACNHPDPVPDKITLDPATWLAPAPDGRVAECQTVHRTLVREIPPIAVPQAVTWLTDRSSMPLSQSQIKKLLPDSDLNRLVEAETSAIDAEDEANRREWIAADPVLTTPAERQAALSHRVEASRLRENQPNLQPYLVRGLQVPEAAGGYAVCEAGDVLQVTHVSDQGANPPSLWFKPLILMLPYPPGVVYVDTANPKA
jgi:hypothetical protein